MSAKFRQFTSEWNLLLYGSMDMMYGRTEQHRNRNESTAITNHKHLFAFAPSTSKMRNQSLECPYATGATRFFCNETLGQSDIIWGKSIVIKISF